MCVLKTRQLVLLTTVLCLLSFNLSNAEDHCIVTHPMHRKAYLSSEDISEECDRHTVYYNESFKTPNDHKSCREKVLASRRL